MASRVRIHQALHYFVQLGVERHVKRSEYSGSDALLESIVTALEEHRDARRQQRKLALLAELVPVIEDRLDLYAVGAVTRRELEEKVSVWLARKGVETTIEGVRAVLGPSVRRGARGRTRRERLLANLAQTIGLSQSTFERTVRLSERGTKATGRLATPEDLERAAEDVPPGRSELLMFVLDGLVEPRLRHALFEQLPPYLRGEYQQAMRSRRRAAKMRAREAPLR